MIGFAFLLLSLVGLLATWNVYRPRLAPMNAAALSFAFGWPRGELALHVVAVEVLMTLGFGLAGAFGTATGVLGLIFSLGSWAGLLLHYRSAQEVEGLAEDALAYALGPAWRSDLPPELAARIPADIDRASLVRPFPQRHADVDVERNIIYTRQSGRNLRLDIYRPRGEVSLPGRGRPLLVQIHGGGWIFGSKNEQGVPLMLHMARQGWVCASVDYRLSPQARWPEHIVDVKRAIAWLREHAADLGIDSEFIVVTGGSAGGHLAALTALSMNDPAFQPGFEDADTRVAGCVPFYGVYDFPGTYTTHPNTYLAELLAKWVMQSSLDEARPDWQAASPLHRITDAAPPFFVLHGEKDSLIPVREARTFVAVLRERSRASVAYLELPGAQHAFEIFASLRALLTVKAVGHWLVRLHSIHLREEEAPVVVNEATAGGRAG
ncbi:MAG: alpha/beta hydrolase [Deltaproteobacteria bacterium]